MLRQKTPLKRKSPLKRTKFKKKAKRNPPTTDEKKYMAWVATLPCSVLNLHCKGRITVQHCQGVEYRGMGQKAGNKETFPLCEAHHLFGPYSIEQMGRKAWEKMHGPQAYHLKKTQEKYRLKEIQDGTFTENTDRT